MRGVLLPALALAGCIRIGDATVIEGRLTDAWLDEVLPARLMAATSLEFRASPGGVFEPFVGFAIRGRGLPTRIAAGHVINSAAALYFVAGTDRAIGRDANACFHRGRCGGAACRDEPARERMRRRYLAVLGLSDEFIRKAGEKSGGDVWCPTPAEWRAEGVRVEE